MIKRIEGEAIISWSCAFESNYGDLRQTNRFCCLVAILSKAVNSMDLETGKVPYGLYLTFDVKMEYVLVLLTKCNCNTCHLGDRPISSPSPLCASRENSSLHS